MPFQLQAYICFGVLEEARELIIKAYDLYKDGDKELELTQKILMRYEEFQELLP